MKEAELNNARRKKEAGRKQKEVRRKDRVTSLSRSTLWSVLWHRTRSGLAPTTYPSLPSLQEAQSPFEKTMQELDHISKRKK